MKEKKINKLDILDRIYLEDKIVNMLRQRKKDGARYSKEFLKTVKNIPYESINNYKIRKICYNLETVLGYNNKISIETEKYYLELINAIKINDKIPLEGIDNVFLHIFDNIQFMYDNLGKELFERIINLYYSTDKNYKILAINSVFDIPYKLPKEQKDYLNTVIHYLENCNDKMKIECLKLCIDNLHIIFDKNWNLKDYKYNILNCIMFGNNSYNPYRVKNLLSDALFKYNIKNTNLINYLLELYLNNNKDNGCAYIFWNRLIKNEYFMTSNNFDFQRDVIDYSKNFKFVEEENINKYVEIILELNNIKNYEIQQAILNKMWFSKNIKTLDLLYKLIPILSFYVDSKNVEKIMDSIEDENGVLTKKLIIDLDINN